MRKYIRIGVDIAKNSFQVHALEGEDCSATKRKLSRSGIVKFLAEVEPCAIGMEACGSAHYWARRFRAMGHEVKLTPPIYVKPYVKRGQERRGGCGGDLRGDVSAKHAFRRRQERGPTGHADGAQDPRTADQAAHDERERLAGSSGRVRCHRRKRDQPRRGTRRESRRRGPSGDGPGDAGSSACAIAVSR